MALVNNKFRPPYLGTKREDDFLDNIPRLRPGPLMMDTLIHVHRESKGFWARKIRVT